MFKRIPGYEKYFACDNGTIHSFWHKKPTILKPCFDSMGKYLFVGLHKNKKIKQKNVHRIIAEAFIPNPENKPQVNHINGIKTNNNVSNLEWVTRSENMQHLYRVLKYKHHNRKLSEKQIKDIFVMRKTGKSFLQIGYAFDVAASTIAEIIWNNRYKEIERK